MTQNCRIFAGSSQHAGQCDCHEAIHIKIKIPSRLSHRLDNEVIALTNENPIQSKCAENVEEKS